MSRQDQSRPDRARPDAASTPESFLEELRAAFMRHSPQGGLSWGFADAFRRLQDAVGVPGQVPDGASGHLATSRYLATSREILPGESGPAPRRGTRGALRRVVPRSLARAVDSMIDERVGRAVDELAAQVVQPLVADIARLAPLVAGLEAARDALRFLDARTTAVESYVGSEIEPIAAPAWLYDPPSTAQWAGNLAAWLRSEGSAGPADGRVVHAECGDGSLLVALAQAGFAVCGVDPRGAKAWDAAERGLDVRVAGARSYLAGIEAGSLGGLILSGFVDRDGGPRAVDAIRLGLCAVASGRPVVVIGTDLDTWEKSVPVVASDLLPGRPLRPETWAAIMGIEGAEHIEVHLGTSGSASAQPAHDRDGNVPTGTFAVVGYRAP
ncbi:MAG: methyltransferase domain-containing protein [Acidimicrobiales bacterium]